MRRKKLKLAMIYEKILKIINGFFCLQPNFFINFYYLRINNLNIIKKEYI